MSQGWAKGSKEFKERVLADLTEGKLDSVVEADALEIRQEKWERALPAILAALGKELKDAPACKKSEPWKVAAARFLRERYLAPYKWIAETLCMGVVGSVQAMVCRHRKGDRGNQEEAWRKLNEI